jgi:hypothetical protein
MGNQCGLNDLFPPLAPRIEEQVRVILRRRSLTNGIGATLVEEGYRSEPGLKKIFAIIRSTGCMGRSLNQATGSPLTAINGK